MRSLRQIASMPNAEVAASMENNVLRKLLGISPGGARTHRGSQPISDTLIYGVYAAQHLWSAL